jgi:hypothetical protein
MLHITDPYLRFYLRWQVRKLDEPGFAFARGKRSRRRLLTLSRATPHPRPGATDISLDGRRSPSRENFQPACLARAKASRSKGLRSNLRKKFP